MRENRAQVSLEYILIFAVSLIVLIAFTMPFLNQTMDVTFDVTDSLDAKSDLSKIVRSVGEVYGEGEGSRHSVNLNLNKPLKISIDDNHISVKIKLKDSKYKQIRCDVKSTLKSQDITLARGLNTITVEWPVGGKNMIIY